MDLSEAKPIVGVATSVAAFVGYTSRGPVNQAVQVSSVTDFEAQFGAIDASSDVSYAVAHFFLNGGSQAWVTRVLGVSDLAHPSPADIIGSEDEKTGIYSLLAADEINILVIPNQASSEIHAAMIDFAKARRAFTILDMPESIDTLAGAQDWIRDVASGESSNGAAYFPRIVVRDAQTGELRSSANSGAVAGIYARTDEQRGVWKAPAGTEARIEAAVDLAFDLTGSQQDEINALGLNALCNFVGFGSVVWGARTLAGADGLASDWKYVPVRRLALFIEESVYRGLRWAIFEPNDTPLWAEVSQCVEAFMRGLFRQGAFQGVKENEAFFVKCDATTTAEDDINRDIMNVLIGFAPVKPSEFTLVPISLRMAA